MATIVRTIEQTSKIRVAVVIEAGRVKPVWFEEMDRPGRDRVFIQKICTKWSHQEGAAKILNFDVWDGANSYRLSLNTRDFTWKLAVAEERPLP